MPYINNTENDDKWSRQLVSKVSFKVTVVQLTTPHSASASSLSLAISFILGRLVAAGFPWFRFENQAPLYKRSHADEAEFAAYSFTYLSLGKEGNTARG